MINNEFGGAAKADLWRYAALYSFGGIYMDDDSYIGKVFETILQPNDQLVLAHEAHGYDSKLCYYPRYKLSAEFQKKSFSDDVRLIPYFKGANVVQWYA
jgi:hypothetical protein